MAELPDGDDLFDDVNRSQKRNNFQRSEFDYDEISFAPNNKLQDKVTSIRRFLDDFQKRLEGYEYVTGFDKVTYTGKVLCGQDLIQKLVALLSPFAENSNLISQGKIEDYYREKYEINSTVNEMLLADVTVSAANYKTIMKTFKNTFKRIGNIINTSRELMRPQFLQEDRFNKTEMI